MKYYALIIISISIISIISCSGNTGHILSKLEEYIYTGYYKKAEDLFSRIDTDKMDDSFMSRYMLLKGYLKYEQGYWGMAEKILDKVQPFENKRVALFLQILYGFLSLSFGDLDKALHFAKGAYHSLFKENTLTNSGIFEEYENEIFLLYKLFIESYRQAGDTVLSHYYLNEITGFCEKYEYENEKHFFTYYSIILQSPLNTPNNLLDWAKKKSVPLVWKIRAGLFALETGVLNHQYSAITDDLSGFLALAQTNHHDLNVAKYMYFFGCIEKEHDRWEKAVSYFSGSSGGFKKCNIISAYYMSEYQYGISLYHNGRYPEAKEVLEKVEEYYRDKGQEELYAELSSYLGSLCKIMGHFKRAENYLLAAYTFYSEDEIVYKEKILECLMNLGVISSVQFEYNRALDYFNDILFYLDDPEEEGSIYYAYLYNNRGQIYKKMGNREDALSQYYIGLKHSPRESEIRARILLNMADCYYSNKEEYKAFTCLEDALFVIKNDNFKKLSGEILYFQARIKLDNKQYEQALLLLSNAIEIFSQIGDLKYKAKALYSASIANKNVGAYKKALACLEEAANIFDTINLTVVGKAAKTEFRKEYEFVLKELINLLVREKEYEKAFLFVEKTKARNLLESLSENDFNVSSLIPRELAQQRQYLIYLKNNLSQQFFTGLSPRSSVIANIKKIDEELSYVNRQIELKVPEVVALEGAGVSTAAEVMAGLGGDEVVLEYEIVGNNLYLFVITKEKLTCHFLNGYNTELDQFLSGGNDTMEIESLAYRYLGMLRDYTSPIARIKSVGKQLFEQLVADVFDDAVKRMNWVIIPDKKLFYLPFASLVNKTGRYLIEENIQVSYSHSATMYIRQKSRKREIPLKPFLFFGLPDNFLFTNWSQDAYDVRDSYPESTCFFNTNAKESTLRTMDITPFKTIQFLLHGFTYDTFDHLNSNGLMFNENEQDGYDGCLILEEIFNLKMNPDLLILTACSSGLGKQIDGEGLYGMNHAFFYSGAQSILSTLWNVYINETNRFSIILNRLQAQGTFTSKESVIKAQKQLFKENPHPVYWAPFVLFGYGGSVN